MTASTTTKKQKKKKWAGAEKLRMVTEARALSKNELGVLLRRERLHATDLTARQAAAEHPLFDKCNRT